MSGQKSAGVSEKESDTEDEPGEAGGSSDVCCLRTKPRGAATMAPGEVRAAFWK